MDISSSILETIKKLIGIDKDYGVFDTDLIVAINSSFTILNQLGVGPNKAFFITGPDDQWSSFFADNEKIELVKSYIYLRARLLFDPPATGVLHEAIERQISEFEWRMMVQSDWNGNSGDSGSGIDHSKLINRDLPDQHPMEAITGLNKKVDTIPAPMKKSELDKILI